MSCDSETDHSGNVEFKIEMVMFWGTHSKDWGFSESFVLPLPLTLQVWCIGRANMSGALWGVVRAHQEMPPVCVEPCRWWARSQLGQASMKGIAAPVAPTPVRKKWGGRISSGGWKRPPTQARSFLKSCSLSWELLVAAGVPKLRWKFCPFSFW